MKPIADRTAWLKGGDARCETTPPRPTRTMRLVLLGAPGVGKGTQAELLCARLGTCHLSTGDIFRAAKTSARTEQTPALAQALECMRRGELVADATMLGILRERLRCLQCHGGFLLDGFPRTAAQANALETVLKAEGLALDCVLDYELNLEHIVARLSGRRTCPRCNAVFHLTTKPPRVEDTCDLCNATLHQREDDRPESIRVRMQAYRQSTEPLVEFYRERGLLMLISAEGSPEEICERTLAGLGGL